MRGQQKGQLQHESEVEKYLRIYKAFLTNKNILQEEAMHEMMAKEAEDTKSKQGINSLSELDIVREVGRGASGVVYQVKSKVDGSQFAMKRIMIKHLSKKEQREVLKEVEMLKSVRHDNIIQYFGSFIESDHLFILMEYADVGDLLSLLKKQKVKKRHFAELELWNISFQIASALLHLHSNNIIHRDIKCLNVFLTSSNRIKLGDLGQSRFLDRVDTLRGKRVGTPLYLSPEVIKQEQYDHRVDIWAFGCLVYQMAAFEPPFSQEGLDSLMHAIQFKQPRPLPGLYSQKFSDFVFKMLEKKVHKRPFIVELFDKFPQKYELTSEHDKKNFEYYMENRQKIEKKKMTDLNAQIINREFTAMKNRIFPKEQSFLMNSYLNSVKTLMSNASQIREKNHPVYQKAKQYGNKAQAKNLQMNNSLVAHQERPSSPLKAESPRLKYRLDTLFERREEEDKEFNAQRGSCEAGGLQNYKASESSSLSPSHLNRLARDKQRQALHFSKEFIQPRDAKMIAYAQSRTRTIDFSKQDPNHLARMRERKIYSRGNEHLPRGAYGPINDLKIKTKAMTQYGEFNMSSSPKNDRGFRYPQSTFDAQAGAVSLVNPEIDPLDGGDSIIDKLIGDNEKETTLEKRIMQSGQRVHSLHPPLHGSMSPENISYSPNRKEVKGSSLSPEIRGLREEQRRQPIMKNIFSGQNKQVLLKELPAIYDRLHSPSESFKVRPGDDSPALRGVISKSNPISSKMVTASLLKEPYQANDFKLQILKTEMSMNEKLAQEEKNRYYFKQDYSFEKRGTKLSKRKWREEKPSGAYRAGYVEKAYQGGDLQEAWSISPNRVYLQPLRNQSPQIDQMDLEHFWRIRGHKEKNLSQFSSRRNSNTKPDKEDLATIKGQPQMIDRRQKEAIEWTRSSIGVEGSRRQYEIPRLLQSAEKKNRMGGGRVNESIEGGEMSGPKKGFPYKKKMTIIDLERAPRE